MLFTFGDCSVDCDRRELRRGDELIAVEPQVFDVLVYLIRHRDRVVSRDDLLKGVWGGRIVSESTLSSRVNSARSAIGDRGDQQQWIRTIARKGFRFVGEIREERGPGDPRAATPPLAEENALPVASAVPAAPQLPDKPSIAVLAFTNMSGDPTQEYFSDGITEDIITGLSRFSELFVIARNSSFQYKGKSPDIRQVGRELGVRYVLEGSIRRAGDRVRISAQLIDAVTGAHRWAERYDRELKDVFAVQDEVSRAVVATLVAHVNKAEAERTLLKPPATWTAYDFFMRASDIYSSKWRSSYNAADVYDARQLLERSISLDPSYARAYATLSHTHLLAWLFRLDEDYLSPAALERAHRLAWRAVQLDPNLPIGHASLGMVMTFEGQHEQSIAAFEKATALNPNYTDWRFCMALVRAGDPARAVQVLETHMRYDPFYVPSVPLTLGIARYYLKEYSEALPPLREFTSRSPNVSQGHIWLAANLAQLGRLDAARAEAAEALRIDPKYTIDGTARRLALNKRPEDTEHFFDGLRKAGLPEK
jgi:adenylate cyclase